MDESLNVDLLPEDVGRRLDQVLADRLDGWSRARIQKLIGQGAVRRNGEVLASPSAKIRAGDRIEAEAPPVDATPMAGLARKMDLNVVYEDADVIVIDKPAGLAMHPAPGHADDTLVNGLLAHCGDTLSGIGGVQRPGIVHRIDKDTSGLVVVAKHDRAHQSLAAQFEAHAVERMYRALVWGTPAPTKGRIEGAIGRDPRNRKRMAVVASGKPAATNYAVVETFGFGAAMVECRLETGRTHQIRVHMAERGWPLIGDPVYGRATRARKAMLSPPALEAAMAFDRQALHAARLGFTHPTTAERLLFESALPDDLAALARALAGV